MSSLVSFVSWQALCVLRRGVLKNKTKKEPNKNPNKEGRKKTPNAFAQAVEIKSTSRFTALQRGGGGVSGSGLLI